MALFEKPRCTKCHLHLGATNVKVKSKGSDRPMVLFVGEAPGRSEDAKGSCFVGKAGRDFDKLMDVSGLPPEYCRWTNVVRCIPWNNDQSSFRIPTQGEIEACMPYLEAEILQKDPVFIVPLGNTALHALLPKAPKIGTARKRRFYLELPSLKFRFRKALNWAKSKKLYTGDESDPLLPPEEPNDKSMQKYLAAAESFGFPHIETKFFTVYPSYHPSAAARGNKAAELAIVEDLGYLRSQVTGDRGIPFGDYEYLDQLEDIRVGYDLIKSKYRNGEISCICVDLETNGLSPYLTKDAKVLLWSVAYGEGKAFTVPFQHHESPFANDPLAQRAIVSMTQDLLETVPVTNHNIKFDLQWLALIGIHISTLKIAGDTMLSSWTLWNDTIKDHSLETLATRHTGMISHKEEMDHALEDAALALMEAGEEREPTMDDIDIDIVHKYCCADVDSCLRLHHIFEGMMAEQNLVEPHHKVCVPAILPTTAMEIAGVRCNRRMLAETKKEYEGKFKEYYEQLDAWGLSDQIIQALNIAKREKARAAGKKPPKLVDSFKLTAAAAKGALLFDVLEFEPKEYGKTGPSVDKAVIGDLMEQCTKHIGTYLDEDGSWSHKLKVIELVRDFTRDQTIYSRYIKPIPDFIDPNDVVHTNFGIRTTRTGRYNCRKPSFHQMPWKSVVKKTFIPHHPHGLILSVDYSQMELRVLASVTGDEDMIEAFRSGADIHRLISSMVLNKPPEEVLDAERRRMKTVVFGLIYGRTARSIAAQEHISEQAAQDLIDKFFARFPKVKEWIKRQHRYAKKHNMVFSPFGFRRLLERFLKDGERNNRAVNTPIQGSASDLGVLGLTNVYRLLTKTTMQTSMFATVHDSILFSIHPQELYDIGVICRKGMVDYPRRDVDWLKCPIKIDYELGPSWGELVGADWLGDHRIKFEKAKPEYYEKMCEAFMMWDEPPILLEENKVLVLEDGSELVHSGRSEVTREAIKEEAITSVWEFAPLLKAA